VSEIESLKKEIAELNELYGSEKKIKKLIIKQLEEIAKKYGQPRRTEIVMEEHIEEITHEHLIETTI